LRWTRASRRAYDAAPLGFALPLQEECRDGLVDSLAGIMTATTPIRRAPARHLDTLSAWLPYRAYLPDEGLFINAPRSAYIMEMPPLVGADDRTADILGLTFRKGCRRAPSAGSYLGQSACRAMTTEQIRGIQTVASTRRSVATGAE
jgi:hypothetical protein